MTFSTASTSAVPSEERSFHKKTSSFDDSKQRVNIHVKLSSPRHNSLPEIVFRSTIAPPEQKPSRRSTCSSTSKVTVQVSQTHISRTPSAPKYLKSSAHRVVVLKGKEGKKNLFIV